MDKFAEKLSDLNRSILLYDYYGKLLSKRSREILDLYFNYDLSIVEISENLGISKQAVYDSIQKSTNKLNDFESQLNLCQQAEKRRNFFTKLKQLIEAGKDTEALALIETTMNKEEK